MQPSIDIETLKNDPQFLEHLTQLEAECKQTQSVAKGYQLLDAYLVIEKDEASLNELFGFLVNNAFDKLAQALDEQKRLRIRDDEEDRAVARAIYEYAMQRFSENDAKGAKELFLVLHYLVDDEEISEAMMVHAAALMAGYDFEGFIERIVKIDESDFSDPLSIFVKDFAQPADILLEMWNKEVDAAHQELARLANNKKA